jgi:hypothetical protein
MSTTPVSNETLLARIAELERANKALAASKTKTRKAVELAVSPKGAINFKNLRSRWGFFAYAQEIETVLALAGVAAIPADSTLGKFIAANKAVLSYKNVEEEVAAG